MNDDRPSWSMVIDVLDVLEKHGYRRGDDQHTGRAVRLVGDLARIYEGTQEVPVVACLVPEPSQVSREQAWRAAAGRVEAIAGAEVPVIMSALDEASDYKRDRAAACSDCADQSCGNCQHRLDAARTYETLASRLQHAIDGVIYKRPLRQAATDSPAKRIQAAPEKEAGQ